MGSEDSVHWYSGGHKEKQSKQSSGLSVSVREPGGIATSEVNLILLLS